MMGWPCAKAPLLACGGSFRVQAQHAVHADVVVLVDLENRDEVDRVLAEEPVCELLQVRKNLAFLVGGLVGRGVT